MKPKLLIVLALVLAAGLATSCRQNRAAVKPDPLARAYDSEPDWNDSSKVIPLNYQQAQGKRVFYQYCVWCHADSTPAGPSNRSNLNPNPPLANDGATLNALSDDFMRNVITLGGAAAGKSASMPPWGKTLSQDDIEAVIAFYRAIAQPPYQASGAAGAQVFGEVERIAARGELRLTEFGVGAVREPPLPSMIPIRRFHLRLMIIPPLRGGKESVMKKVMISLLASVPALSVAFLATLNPTSVRAVPSYARQTGLPCSGCHYTPPELNPAGRKFKLLGYVDKDKEKPGAEIKDDSKTAACRA